MSHRPARIRPSDGRPELIAPDTSGEFLARLIDEWGLGFRLVGPDVGTAAGFSLPRGRGRVTSLTVGGGAVAFRSSGRCAPKEIIRRRVWMSCGAGRRDQHRHAAGRAAIVSEPDVRDYVSAYDLGRFAESAGSCGIIPSRTRCCVACCRRSPRRQIVAGRNDDLVPWSTTSTSTTSSNSEIHPLEAGHFAWVAAEDYGAWSSTGSAAGIGASQRANPNARRRHAAAEPPSAAPVWVSLLAWPCYVPGRQPGGGEDRRHWLWRRAEGEHDQVLRCRAPGGWGADPGWVRGWQIISWPGTAPGARCRRHRRCLLLRRRSSTGRAGRQSQ